MLRSEIQVGSIELKKGALVVRLLGGVGKTLQADVMWTKVWRPGVTWCY